MTPIRLRQLHESDIPRCQELRAMVGWNQTDIDWRRFLSANPEGCFAATLDAAVIGTVCAIAYPNGFGWVAMVIVDPAHQRKGVGKQLLNAGIAHLQNRGLAVKLDATPAGKLLYDSLGFVDEYLGARMECDSPPLLDANRRCAPIPKSAMQSVIDFDAPIFGSPRPNVLESYFHFYPDCIFGMYDGANLTGFIMGREGSNAFHIGPWVALNEATATALLDTAISARKPDRIFIDIVEPNPSSRPMLETLGFVEQRPLIRMVLGDNLNPGQPENIYGMSGPELG